MNYGNKSCFHHLLFEKKMKVLASLVGNDFDNLSHDFMFESYFFVTYPLQKKI